MRVVAATLARRWTPGCRPACAASSTSTTVHQSLPVAPRGARPTPDTCCCGSRRVASPPGRDAVRSRLGPARGPRRNDATIASSRPSRALRSRHARVPEQLLEETSDRASSRRPKPRRARTPAQRRRRRRTRLTSFAAIPAANMCCGCVWAERHIRCRNVRGRIVPNIGGGAAMDAPPAAWRSDSAADCCARQAPGRSRIAPLAAANRRTQPTRGVPRSRGNARPSAARRSSLVRTSGPKLFAPKRHACTSDRPQHVRAERDRRQRKSLRRRSTQAVRTRRCDLHQPSGDRRREQLVALETLVVWHSRRA